MFITRAQFQIYKDYVRETQEEDRHIVYGRLTELEDKVKALDSLAKELGYEWTSEAVKEIEDGYTVYGAGRVIETNNGSEKAVLKWGWKKKDDFTEEWDRQAKIKKK